MKKEQKDKAEKKKKGKKEKKTKKREFTEEEKEKITKRRRLLEKPQGKNFSHFMYATSHGQLTLPDNESKSRRRAFPITPKMT